jgi:hypothetical protein
LCGRIATPAQKAKPFRQEPFPRDIMSRTKYAACHSQGFDTQWRDGGTPIGAD